jgi:hypothetical protein
MKESRRRPEGEALLDTARKLEGVAGTRARMLPDGHS